MVLTFFNNVAHQYHPGNRSFVVPRSVRNLRYHRDPASMKPDPEWPTISEQTNLRTLVKLDRHFTIMNRQSLAFGIASTPVDCVNDVSQQQFWR